VTQPREPKPKPPDPGESRELPLPEGRRVIRGDLSRLLGRSWGQTLTGLVLLASAGVDVATFYQVMVVAMDAPEALVWTAVVGFTAVALWLAHTLGMLVRDARGPGRSVKADPAVRLYFGVWATLGLTAFVVRWYINASDPNVSGSTIVVDGRPVASDYGALATSQFLSALLFLVLYVATGLVSARVGFKRPNVASDRWKLAERKMTAASETYADLQSSLTHAEELRKFIDQERERREQEWKDLDAQSEDALTTLEEEAELWISQRPRPAPAQEPPPTQEPTSEPEASPCQEPPPAQDPLSTQEPTSAQEPPPVQEPSPVQEPLPPTRPWVRTWLLIRNWVLRRENRRE
jgi:hypothetical protein